MLFSSYLPTFSAIDMRWQIEQFVFCDQQQTLQNGENSQQLEPMAVELLNFFCQNPQQIISKDLLIEQVWLGRVVSDNAISRLVTKLRKVLEDDPRKPRFIATFPKKGYKFIASVSKIESPDPVDAKLAAENELSESTDQTSAKLASSPSSESREPTATSLNTDSSNTTGRANLTIINSMTKWLALILLVTAVGWWMLPGLIDKPASLTHAQALTRDSGDEYFPSVSPDGTRVTYMASRNGRMHLMIKRLEDERIIEIEHGADMGTGPANWSKDGKMIVYLAASRQRCQYFIRRIDGLSVSEPALLHNCPAGSYGKIIFTHDNNRLIYSEAPGLDSPYSMFEIDRATHKKRRLNQPKLELGGNSQFDLHPTKNLLLISSPDKQQWEGFYKLNLDSDELELLFKQDAYICCGIWSHDGKRVILIGEHPAYQLLSYDLDGEDIEVVYSDTLRLSRPSRHPNGRDYLFVSSQSNVDFNTVKVISSDTQGANQSKTSVEKSSITSRLNSSVDDRLATYSPMTGRLAFIGLSTGQEEIWISKPNDRVPIKLSNFRDSRHYIDLKWSPNEEYLLALTLNEIHLINSVSGEYEVLKIPQSEIRWLSFKDNSSISYSIYKNGQWLVHYYDIESGIVSSADQRWKYISYTPNIEDTLWLDQNDQLYYGESVIPAPNQRLLDAVKSNRRTFNIKKFGVRWIWYDWQEGGYLWSYQQSTDTHSELIQTPVQHFDYYQQILIYGDLKLGNADIYQTRTAARP
jgi:DNA-binding winged helix-turn-helix (wHTH) protein